MSDTTPQIDFQLYRYTPSIAAAILFTVLFFLTTAFHLYQLIRNKTWYFIAFVLGGIFQIIGYIGRAVAHSNVTSIPIYSIQTILILLAPPLYAASIYMVLGRLIHHLHAESLSVVRLSWMTGIFVTGDVISFVMQAAGGGIMASGTISAMNTGEKITIGGLCVQLVFFTFFVLTSVVFHVRIRRKPTQRTIQIGQRPHPLSLLSVIPSWESVLWGLYIACVLILIRSVFRLIEYAQGNDGYLISHEVFSYVFDATLMFFAMLAINVFHPSVVLSSSEKREHDSMEVLRSPSRTQ